jgi:MoaA/NifB/PqqE/SkfB family radical SAM enzyme
MPEKQPPLVWGYRWPEQAVKEARQYGKLLRVSIAVPGGPPPEECNLRCIFCFTNGGQRSRTLEQLSNNEVVDIARQAAELAYDKDLMNYFFCSEGEPTLNPDLPLILQETAKLGGTMTIFSNLYNLSDKILQAFKETKNLFICGKLYSLDEEKADYLMGVKGAFKQTMNNIERLAESGLADEGRLGVQCVVTSVNENEILDIFKFGRKNGIVPHVMMFRAQGRGAETSFLEVPPQRLKQVYQECARFDNEAYGYEWIAEPPMMAYGTCVIPGNNVYVVTNGDVHICAGITDVVGNIRTQPLETIVHHPILENMRRSFTTCPWLVEINKRMSGSVGK